MGSEDANVTDEDTTKMLSDLLIDNAQLRMRLNAVIRNAVNTAVKPEKEGSGEVLPKKTVLNWLLDRWESTDVYSCELDPQTFCGLTKVIVMSIPIVPEHPQDKLSLHAGEPGGARKTCLAVVRLFIYMEITED